MKRLYIIATLALIALIAVSSCTPSNPSSGGGDEGGVPSMPEPPEQAIDAHVFIVDIFTTLDDESFFARRDVSVAKEYIRAQQQKLSLAYLFDRADFIVGECHPMTDIALSLGVNQLFAQSASTGEYKTEGTGIITRYPISDYDGIASDGAYLSGFRMSVPVTGTPSIYISTARISSLDQARTIYEARKHRLVSDCVVIGTVASDVRDEVVKFFNLSSVRAMSYGSADTAYDLLVLCPADYVCRGIEAGKTVNLPYYRVSIEKWM